MGIEFQKDFFLRVREIHLYVSTIEFGPFKIVMIKEKVYVHLVPLSNNFTPSQLLSLQAIYQQKGLTLVHLWEDVWLTKRSQVLSRIQSFCGENKSLHARKAKIVNVERVEVQSFLAENHLQGYIKTKYNYGLELNHTLVAVACFSDTRPMKSKGKDYKSAELIRFATIKGSTLVGGLSKLIKHFTTQVTTNDLMTYADRDWSLGKGYDQLKFTFSGNSAPVSFYLDELTHTRYALHRLPKKIQLAYSAQNILNLDDFLMENRFTKIFTTGNLKYHLYT